MSVINTFPITRLTSGAIAQVGVDLVIAAAGVDLPGDGHSSYEVALHKDGSHCSTECGCISAENRTTVWEDCSIEVGEWTWQGTRYFLIGWRRSGPTEAETELAENLESERANHQVTNADLITNIRRLERLQAETDATHGRLEGVRSSLRTARDVLDHTERQRRRAAWAALAGWTVAAVLAAVLLLAVIA